MTKSHFNHISINDPIHGPINLSKLESKIINTPAFLRLKNLMQLGLSYFVFPGATHTRFSHSLGALHLIAKMIESINQYCDKNDIRKPIDSKKIKELRLAALLHDIGHYPLSHATEYVVYRIANEKLPKEIKPKQQPGEVSTNPLQEMADVTKNESVNHVQFGKEVVIGSKEINDLLKKDGLEPEAIANIFTGEYRRKPILAQLISSTLDADRLDYLLRDSHYAGVPYGHVDTNFIISNLIYDKKSKLMGVDYKGIPGFEHYLISRFFSYNITFHKTVVGFELMAKALFYQMTKEKHTVGEFGKLKKRIGNKKYLDFNDTYFWHKLSNWKPKKRVKYYNSMKGHLINRIPLKLLSEERQLKEINGNNNPFKILRPNVLKNIEVKNLLRRNNILSNDIVLVSRTIKFEDESKFTEHTRQTDENKSQQLGKVYEDYKFKDLIDVDYSVISKLSNYALSIKRLYYFNRNSNKVDRGQFQKELMQICDQSGS